MSEDSSSPTRRSVLAATAAVGAFGIVTSVSTGTLGSARAEGLAHGDAIRPFRIDVPESKLIDLRKRIEATNWPGGKRSRMNRKACSSQRCRSSRAIGRHSTFVQIET
jgi:hypothetical protein